MDRIENYFNQIKNQFSAFHNKKIEGNAEKIKKIFKFIIAIIPLVLLPIGIYLPEFRMSILGDIYKKEIGELMAVYLIGYLYVFMGIINSIFPSVEKRYEKEKRFPFFIIFQFKYYFDKYQSEKSITEKYEKYCLQYFKTYQYNAFYMKVTETELKYKFLKNKYDIESHEIEIYLNICSKLRNSKNITNIIFHNSNKSLSKELIELFVQVEFINLDKIELQKILQLSQNIDSVFVEMTVNYHSTIKKSKYMDTIDNVRKLNFNKVRNMFLAGINSHDITNRLFWWWLFFQVPSTIIIILISKALEIEFDGDIVAAIVGIPITIAAGLSVFDKGKTE